MLATSLAPASLRRQKRGSPPSTGNIGVWSEATGTFRRRTLLRPAVLAVGLAIGCAAPPPPPAGPLEAPPVSIAESHYFGTPLSGPVAAQQSADVDRAASIRASLLALAEMPEDALDPLASRRNLIVSMKNGLPTQATGRLGVGVRAGLSSRGAPFLEGLGTGRWVLVEERIAVVPAGTTCALAMTDAHRGTSSWNPSYEVMVHSEAGPAKEGSPPGALAVAFAAQGPAPIAPPRTDGGGAMVSTAAGERGPPIWQGPGGALGTAREVSLIDVSPVAGGEPLVLLVPAPPHLAPTKGLALIIEVLGSPPEAEADRAGLTAAMDRCREALVSRTAQAPAQEALAGAPAGREEALKSLQYPALARRAMEYLGSSCGAPIARDVALVADNFILERVTRAVLARAAGKPMGESDQVGWAVEVGTLQVMAELLESETLPSPLASVLALHAGLAGRAAFPLERIVAQSKTLEDVRRLIVLENHDALEAASPASRVRAFDWLASQGLAPEGYDPLAPSRERRAALEKALEEDTKAREEALAKETQGGKS